MQLHKYQALGNDYLVVEEHEAGILSPTLVQRLCDRHFGPGSDGILVSSDRDEGGRFGLRILNPDGSEAEKSGNGLRIFARYLFDAGRVQTAPFEVSTPGGIVRCEVKEGGDPIVVEMGRASFDSEAIAVTGPPRNVVNESASFGGREFQITAVTVGNPHCVIPCDEISESLAREVGPLIETDNRFPNRTNVQFLQRLDDHRIRIEIWERGAGYTLASGSSSCAAAATAVRLGLCTSPLTVEMPGGSLEIGVADDYALTMTGPARRVYTVTLAEEF